MQLLEQQIQYVKKTCLLFQAARSVRQFLLTELLQKIKKPLIQEVLVDQQDIMLDEIAKLFSGIQMQTQFLDIVRMGHALIPAKNQSAHGAPFS